MAKLIYRAVIENDRGYHHVVKGKDLAVVRRRAFKKARQLLSKRAAHMVTLMDEARAVGSFSDPTFPAKMEEAFFKTARCFGFMHDPWGFRTAVMPTAEGDEPIPMMPKDPHAPSSGWAICCVIYCDTV